MSVYIVTGKLGNGKSLVTVARIRDYIRRGSRIATNLDINLTAMFGRHAKKIDLIRVPDKPNIHDLELIGEGYKGDYDESNFGALVLDECGTWFNSRNWQDKERKAVNDWFLHTRKLGWDVFLIIQDISILDSQAREAIAELLVTCRRLDKIRIPFVSAPIKILTGWNPTLPRLHRAKVVYADGLINDVWNYRGTDLYNCYDTRQKFSPLYQHGTHSVLTPWHIKGRYSVPMTMENIMRITKIHWRRFKSPVALATGVLLGISAAMLFHTEKIEKNIVRYNLQKSIHENKNNSNPANDPATKTSAPASTNAPEKDKLPTPEGKLAAFIAKLRIIGTFNVNENKAYTFSTGEPDKYLTSSDVSGMGFAIKPLSDCMAEISIDGQTNLIRCL